MTSWHPVFPCHIQQDEWESKWLCSTHAEVQWQGTSVAVGNSSSVTPPNLVRTIMGLRCELASQGLHWVNWSLLAALLESCCNNVLALPFFFFFPPFYLKQWAFYMGRMRSILCIDLLFVVMWRTVNFCLILISSKMFWYKESGVWWDYPRSLLRMRKVNCRNFTVPASWWYSLLFWFWNGIILEYIFVNHCHLTCLWVQKTDLCVKLLPVLSWLIK